MIALIKGLVDSISGKCVVVDVQGVGYEVICSSRALSLCITGEPVRLEVHTDVKEDSIRLYGFADNAEKQVFLLLIQVQGVGCKSAADIVSQIDSLELLRVIGEGDENRLQTIKGVGKKTAQRIVVELKDKVAQFAVDRKIEPVIAAGQRQDSAAEDSIQALQALGFMRKDAERAVQAALEKGGFDLRDSGQIVKEALRFI